MSERDDVICAGALMLIAGGIIGAGVALLFAPQSGQKTRKQLTGYAKKARRKTEDVIDDFSDAVTDMVDAVGDKASDILEKGKDMAHSAKKDLLKVLEEGEARLEKQRARLSKLVG